MSVPQSEPTVPSPTADGHGPVALITGGSRGIGRACALRLSRAGYRLVLVYAANAAQAAKTLAEVRGAGGVAIALRADVADEQAMAAVFDRAKAEFGGLDTVVHAAGRMELAPIADLKLSVLDELHRTNIRGTFVVDQLAARRLRAGGSIINFSTSVVATSFPSYGAYAASKAAVEAITLILARELRGRDITVNAVAPGPTATDLFLEGKTSEQVRQLAQAVPLERLAEPGDIAEVVAFLAGPAGHWVNGQTIRANGGLA